MFIYDDYENKGTRTIYFGYLLKRVWFATILLNTFYHWTPIYGFP